MGLGHPLACPPVTMPTLLSTVLLPLVMCASHRSVLNILLSWIHAAQNDWTSSRFGEYSLALQGKQPVSPDHCKPPDTLQNSYRSFHVQSTHAVSCCAMSSLTRDQQRHHTCQTGAMRCHNCLHNVTGFASWAGLYNTWLLMKPTPKGTVFSFLSLDLQQGFK